MVAGDIVWDWKGRVWFVVLEGLPTVLRLSGAGEPQSFEKKGMASKLGGSVKFDEEKRRNCDGRLVAHLC